jgi:hypothetical protein
MARDTCLSYRRAIDALHVTGSRLILMRSHRDGDQFFIIPGARGGQGDRVQRGDAEKILARPDAVVFDAGLFPNNPQSWVIIGRTIETGPAGSPHYSSFPPHPKEDVSYGNS